MKTDLRLVIASSAVVLLCSCAESGASPGVGTGACVASAECMPGWSCIDGVCVPPQADDSDAGIVRPRPVGSACGVELCDDGIDNDCDEVIEEACACLPGATQSCFTGPAPARWVGLCIDGSMTCIADHLEEFGMWGPCEGDVPPADEVCDPGGLDESCNGLVDEGCPGVDAGVLPGPDAGAPPGSDAGAPPGSDAGAPPGSDAGAPPGSDAGVDVGLDAGTDAGGCRSTAGDRDGDGLLDAVDADDDGDGIPDVSDEFPLDVVVSDVTIGFDTDPGGRTLGHDEVVAEQYASMGVRFTSGYRVARRASSFTCYNGTSTLNVLCTRVGASNGWCTAPASRDLVATITAPVDFASVEMRTRCDGPYDGDRGTVTAVSGGVTTSQAVIATNAAAFPNEGMGRVSIRSDRMTRLTVAPGDFDSIDTLRLVDLAPPCP